MTTMCTATERPAPSASLHSAAKSLLGALLLMLSVNSVNILRAQDAPTLQDRLRGFVLQLAPRPEVSKQNKNDIRIWDAAPADFFESHAMQAICEAISARENQRMLSLLSDGFQLNAVGQHGMTLLYWAYLEGNLDAFKVLLERGASPDIPVTTELLLKPGVTHSRTRRHSVLIHAYRNSRVRPGFFEAGIEYTKKPNQLDDLGRTFLHHCVAHLMTSDQLDLLAKIIKTGVDLDARNRDGKTALHIAAGHNPDSMLQLLQAGADPSVPMPDGTLVIDVVRDRARNSALRDNYQRVLDWLDPPAVGQLLPAAVQKSLGLSADQLNALHQLQAEVDARLSKILTEDQLSRLRRADPVAPE